MNGSKPRIKSKGAFALETAYILPILLAAVFGVCETGNLFRSWLTLQKAAQAGARFAATGIGAEEGTRLSQIINETGKVTASLPDDLVNVVVRSWPGPASGSGRDGNPGDPCDTVEVEVRLNYEPIVPLLESVLPESIVLTGVDRQINEPWYPCNR